MPAPASIHEFLELIRKSGVVEESKLNSYLTKIRESDDLPSEISKLAGKMVRDAILTYFQAEQLLQGKWKRFTIGKYRVLEKLGVGGMGQVFLCEHKLMRRRVAVKVLPAAKGQDEASRERFYLEARAVAALDHPNIVRAYDVDHDEGLHFLVMEFVDGVNLQDLVKRSGPLDPYRACHYIYSSAAGLQYANDTGIIHRDIKPSNILVDRTGVVKILDMGLARFFNTDEDHSLTKKYDENVLGTADYLAPEQAVDSHGVTIKADLYSLGGTFYYLLTGLPPYPEGSVAQKLLWHQTRDPKSIKLIRPEVPDEIVRIVEKLMKKDPNERYSSPAELMSVLQEFVTIPIPPPNEKEHPALSPAAAGAANPSQRTTTGILIAGGLPASNGSNSRFDFRSGTGNSTQQVGSSISQPAAAQTATNTLTQSDVSVGVWASLESDTAPRNSTDATLTTRPDSVSQLNYRPTTAHGSSGTKKYRKQIAIGSGISLTALAAVVYFAYFSNKSTTNPDVKDFDFSRVYVTKGTGPGNAPTFKTVLDAISAIKKRPEFDESQRKGSGPIIVILDESHQENAFTLNDASGRIRDLSIESENPSKPIRWTVPDETNAKFLLQIRRAEGLTLRGIIFDAENKLDHGLILGGLLTNVRIEDVTIRGCNLSSIRLDNVAGEQGKPCIINRTNLIMGSNASCAIHIARHERSIANNLDSANIKIHDCRFQGSGNGSALSIDTPVKDIEFYRNRVFLFQDGCEVRQPIPATGPFKLTIAKNTFHSIRGAAFQSSEFDLPANADIDFTKNYFVEVKSVGEVKNLPKVPNFQSIHNFRDQSTGDGNLIQKSTVMNNYTISKPNPDDDASFLRYPLSAPLAKAGPNQSPVGFPPN